MRSKIVALVVGLSALVALPALADESKGGGRPSFPMPAAQFKQMVEARQARARNWVEQRATKLPADQAKAMRDHFAANTAKVNAEVAKAVADGTVTKEEAQAVRAAAPHGGGGGGHCGKGKAGTKA